MTDHAPNPSSSTDPKPGTAAPSNDLPKAYKPSEHEDRIRARWESTGAFHADPSRVLNGEAEPYAIVIPPPNVTAALHLGHALNNTLQDVLVRAHRMKGFETLWMPGTDHAGIATQSVVEKRVLKEEGKRRADFKGEEGRREFVGKIQAFKDEYEKVITDQLKRMGCSCDWERQRFTMDDVCAAAVREAFFQLFKDGLIYRGKRLVNWDPVSQTALSDDEVEMEEVDGHFFYLRYPLVHKPSNATDPRDAEEVTWDELASRGYPGASEQAGDENAWVTVATTRPETYLGDTAVAINPRDPRAAALRGLYVQLPLVGRVIPIVEDDYVVMPAADPEAEGVDAKAKYATGFLKVTPAHDPNDYEIGRRHNLPVINVMAPDASISDAHGWTDVGDARGFVGLSREEARKKVVAAFKERGLLEAQKPYRHSVGHSYRSHAAIEPYLSDQWYVKVTDPTLAGAALDAMVHEQRGSKANGGSSLGGTALQSGGSAIDSFKSRPLAPAGFVGMDPYPPFEPSPNGLIRSLRNLPHVELKGATYFVTWRLMTGALSAQERTAVLESMRHGEGEAFDLFAACVMPDHVHAIIRPLQTIGVGEWVSGVKKFTARRINESRRTNGHLWQDERFDHIVRDRGWLGDFVEYIVRNPVEDGLCNKPSEYPWMYVSQTVLKQITQESSQRHTALESGATKDRDSGDGSLKFYPERYAKTYETWHENIRDWCISRQLWWGHRIPVWHKRLELAAPEADLFFTSQYDEVLERNHARCVGIAVDAESGEVLASESLYPWSDAQNAHVLRKTGTIDLYFCDIEDGARWERDGFRQDPDVLDTWFSSALWPMSTMGWPDAVAAAKATGIADFPQMLDAFNSTSVLCTAREIITLWVSRMVMFNRYLRPEGTKAHRHEGTKKESPEGGKGKGPVPFRDVFIHSVIQDGEGRKMSKSLGNGVDPLDIIESHGSDAMRFTLVQMTTSTQDVRMPVERDPTSGKNTSPKFDQGRNFCNKLWNAARFVVSILEKAEGTEAQRHEGTKESVRAGDLSLIDRWMLSRVAATVADIDQSLASYQYAPYATAMYDLLWRDFCDWYLEAIKPTVASSAPQRAVLRATLDAILRMLHPIAPYITEAIHERVRSLPPTAAIAGLDLVGEPKDAARRANAKWNGLLCREHWPKADAALRDAEAEASFERLRQLVTACREVRSQHQVAPKRRVKLHVHADLAAEITSAAGMVETLAGLAEAGVSKPTGASVSFMFDSKECFLSDLADQVDASAERERLTKQIVDLDKSITALEGRLGNPGYADRAPKHLVDQTRDQLAKAIADREAARANLARLS
ncbi:MAG: class I tRNA ligase family protein [Phycisphaeraceae bacterium]|nr:class I tRNA ligase family protein [Phycisphaeraceae bacterium]